MTDPGPRRRTAGSRGRAAANWHAVPRGGTLGLRLALAFLSVALAAVALLAGLTAAFAAADVSNLASQQRADAGQGRRGLGRGGVGPEQHLVRSRPRVRPRPGRHHRRGRADPRPGRAGRRGLARLRDRTGGSQSSLPIVVRGQRVGTALVRSTGSGLNAADRSLQTALLRAIAGAAGLAALLALLTGLAVARRITRPVIRLIAATRAMAAGTAPPGSARSTRPASCASWPPPSTRWLSTLDRQEQIRRNLVADVAHELRTPIAILQAGHEALLDGVAEPTPAELGLLRDEVLRLARMVGDLQTLAAADAAALNLARSPGRPGRARRHRGRQPGPPVRGGGRHPGPGPGREPGAGRPALAAPGDHEPAHQRAEVHPVRRPRHDQHRTDRRPRGPCASPTPVPGSPPTTCRASSTGSSAASRPPQISGSGIGLTVAAELAQAHGGRLTAASETKRLGHGTQMTLSLPSA